MIFLALNDLELEDLVEPPFRSLKLWTKRILASEFFFLKLPKACCPRQSCSPFSQVFHLPPFKQPTDRSWIKTSLAFYIPDPGSCVNDAFLGLFPFDHPHLLNRDIKNDGRTALLLQAIHEWLLTLTFLASLSGMNLNIFPRIERHWASDSEGASGIRALKYFYCAPGDSTVVTPLFTLHCFSYGYC